MQRGRGGRDDFFGFGDPFSNFGSFGRPGRLISGFFGGSDPFDDPFFNNPFGSMMGPSMLGPGMLGPSMLGPSMLGPSMFGSRGSIFEDHTNAGFLEHQAPQSNKSKGPIIKEILSDDEDESEVDKSAKEMKENPRKHSRSGKEPYSQDPDDVAEEKKIKYIQSRDQYSRVQPGNHTYSFQSSTITYGGHNGPYHTSSTTRKTGGDGVTIEESREADTTTRKATHRISRGISNKGHSVTRKLNSDGRVDTMETLHNLQEDELSGFEQSWKGSARQYLPGWDQELDLLNNARMGSSRGNRQNGQPGGWALPSATPQPNPGRMRSPGYKQPSSPKGRTS